MVLCDCGANAECTAEYLLQFAYLGSYYAQRVMGIEQPRVGLLNIGAEEEKGDALRHEAYALLKEPATPGASASWATWRPTTPCWAPWTCW